MRSSSRYSRTYDELTAKISDPAVMSDQKAYAKLAKEHRAQTALADKAKAYLAALDSLEEAKEMLRSESDPEMREMAADEVREIEATLPAMEDELKVMLLPSDPNDEKDTIVEIRAGAGGDEAAIFAGELYRMYVRYAEGQRWKVEEIDSASPRAAASRRSRSASRAITCTRSSSSSRASTACSACR